MDELREVIGASAAVLAEALGDAGLLRRSPLGESDGAPWATQLRYLDDVVADAASAQRRLQDARVAIVGVGGVGSVVLQHLVGAGVRSFVLVDHDRVARSNLNRQFVYNAESVGRPKVQAARDWIAALVDDADVAVVDSFVATPADALVLPLDGVDLIVNAADRPAALPRILSAASVARDVPLATASVGRQRGSWGPLVVPRRTPCLACWLDRSGAALDPELADLRAHTAANPIVASFGPTNTVISALLAKDVLMYLAGAGSEHILTLGRELTFDFAGGAVSPSAALPPCSCWNGA